MMKIGITSESPARCDRADVEAAQRERHAERDAEDDHRERPQHVEQGSDDRVGRPAEVARYQPQDDREDRRDQRRRDADQERVAAAVEQPHHDVAAVAVRAQEELAVRLEPLRADRHAVEADHVLRLAVDRDRVGQVVRVDAGLARPCRPRPAPPRMRAPARRRGRRRTARPCCASAAGARASTARARGRAPSRPRSSQAAGP